MPALPRCLRLLVLPVLGWAALLPPGRAEEPGSAEPPVFRTTLRIEPNRRQLATMPASTAEWRLTPDVAAQLDRILVAGRFAAPVAAALRERLKLQPATGEGVITADAALLDLFQGEERLRWWAVLARHPSTRSYRWPMAIRLAELDPLEREPGFAEAVRRLRRWGVVQGPRLFFGDLFALDGAFADAATRINFFQKFMGADSVFLTLVSDSPDQAVVAERSAYWMAGGRSRAIEPMLAAVAHIKGHGQIDLAHLLPRLARSLLYTYPPDFAKAREPAVENAAVAMNFFSATPEARLKLPDSLAVWLAANCDRVEGPREFGDIVVFEDPARNRWPFVMTYITDGIVFGRRPEIYGPWELLPEAEVPRLNPLLPGRGVMVYRPRLPDDKGSLARTGMKPQHWLPPGWSEHTAVQELPPGPWGRLKFYDVLLAPSTELLERLVEPDPNPTWVFADTAPQEFMDTIAGLDVSADVRRELRTLFALAEPDEKGLITVHPSPALVLATPPAFRERHFNRLQHGAAAHDYAQDVSIPVHGGASGWLTPGYPPAPGADILSRLLYRNGRGGLALSDFGMLYHALPDPEVRRATLRALYRYPAVIMLLERPRPEEVPALLDYWRLDQQSSMAQLLESFAGARDMAYLDVVHLLPPLSREMMNVYVWGAVNRPSMSCYWTALNFAAEQPDPRLLVTPANLGVTDQLAWGELQTEYVRVASPERLGDVIAYRRKADGALLHVCTYVAADIVYTKNGFGFSSPWCLMHRADVDSLYLGDGTVQQLVFRKKPRPDPGTGR